MKWSVIVLMLAGRVAAAKCPPAPVAVPQVTLDDARRIVQLRVIRADVRSSSKDSRCVDLELEVIDSFRGSGSERPHDHLKISIAQATAQLHLDRPAGAWWTQEQELAKGRELMAFCPDAGDLRAQLQARCSVHMAEPDQVADLGFEREAESARWDTPTLVAKARARCATASYWLGAIVWRHAGKDLAAFTEVAKLLEDPACTQHARETLLDRLYGAASATDDLPRTRVLVRALFHLLAMPAAADLQNAIVEPYLPNLLGLNGGLPKRTVADLLDADALKAARAALAAYSGKSNAAPLRAWLRSP